MTTATTKTSSKQAPQGYWSRIWKRLRRNQTGMSGLFIVVILLTVSLITPLLANDRPIVASYKGTTYYPAFTTYVDLWVPWQSMRNDIKSWKTSSGGFPFSDHYPALEGETWKEVAHSPDMGMSIWPVIPWNPKQFDPSALKLKPSDSDEHILGTDDQGRDVLARMLHGTVVAMMVGLVVMGISCAIGITLGLAAGYLGGWVDLILSRITEIVMCFPTFFLIIAVIAFLEPSMMNIMAVLGLVGWTRIFRLVRGEVLKCRELDYVLSAQALGARPPRIMFRHILPNAISPVFVAIAFGIARAVLTETSLSFLGFGDPTVPSWGEIVHQGRSYVSQGLWHLTVFPGFAIFVTLTGFNLFGQGLRDAMDPKLLD